MTRQAVKHCFWVCLWEYFRKRWAFASVDWVKFTISNASGHPPLLWEPEWNTSKHQRKGKSAACGWVGASLSSHPWTTVLLIIWTLGPLVLRLLNLDWTTQLVSPSLQFCTHQKKWLLGPGITWANSYKKYFLFSFLFYWIHFSREPWLIHTCLHW